MVSCCSWFWMWLISWRAFFSSTEFSSKVGMLGRDLDPLRSLDDEFTPSDIEFSVGHLFSEAELMF